jgi:hypothetical protein
MGNEELGIGNWELGMGNWEWGIGNCHPFSVIAHELCTPEHIKISSLGYAPLRCLHYVPLDYVSLDYVSLR